MEETFLRFFRKWTFEIDKAVISNSAWFLHTILLLTFNLGHRNLILLGERKKKATKFEEKSLKYMPQVLSTKLKLLVAAATKAHEA